MQKPIVKKYNKEDLTVVWQPKMCIHSERCWRGLISVFNPKNKPWVNMDGATKERIMEQVDQCPSGALSYIYKGEEQKTSSVEIDIMKNGPYIVKGPVKITQDGLPPGRSKTNTVALCRCGGSSTKPFCDGSHNTNGFQE